ncbi:MAG: hypothetical protein AAB360_01930 [Patescibacteria group bacterium]
MEIKEFFKKTRSALARVFGEGNLRPRPDFSREPIELTVVQHWEEGGEAPAGQSYIPFFSNIPPHIAKKNGWVNSYGEYLLMACLEFARRYPNHELSKYWRSVSGFTDKEILAVSTGKMKIVIED